MRRLAWPTSPGAFRLWLALVVVLHHVTRIEVGKAPVLVFFALSGYWVHLVWQRQYAQTRQAWLSFMVSRWWRIAPVLMLASVVCVPLLWVTGDPNRDLVTDSASWQALSTVGVFGYALLPTRPVGPAWSLDIEMQFYLVAPLLVRLVKRVSAIVVLAGGFGVFLAAMVLGAGVTLPSFLVFFLIGMVAAEGRWSPPRLLAHSGLGLAIGLTVLAVCLPAGRAFVTEGGSQAALFNLALGMLAMPFALATVTRKGDKLDGWCADQSYLVYMLHWPAIAFLRDMHLVGWIYAVMASALLLGVFLVSHFVWVKMDRPLNRWRKHWVQSRLLFASAGPEVTKGGDKQGIFA